MLRAIILDLPAEILVEIFVIALDVDLALDAHGFVSDSWPDLMNTRIGSWGLSQVCSSWREIIFSLPSLWTNLRITLYATKMYVQEDILNMYLLGSGILPLNVSIRIVGSTLPYDRSIQQSEKLEGVDLSSIEKLLASSERWESFKFQSFCGFRSLLEMYIDGFSSLQRLHLHFLSDGSLTEALWDRQTFVLFQKMSSLKRLFYYQDFYAPLKDSFPTQDLRHFGFNSSVSWTAVAHCTSLTNLTLRAPSRLVRASNTIQLPQLKTVNIEDGTCITQIAEVGMPALEEIIFDTPLTRPMASHFDWLRPSRHRDIFRVRRVICLRTVHGTCFHSFIGWIKQLEHLQTLEICPTPFRFLDTILGLLEPGVLPSLVELIIHLGNQALYPDSVAEENYLEEEKNQFELFDCQNWAERFERSNISFVSIYAASGRLHFRKG
jgi:hypothetical protein